MTKSLAATDNLEARIQEIGKQLLTDALTQVPSLLSFSAEQRTAAERNMLFDLCMKKEDTARAIFQFMDVFPALQNKQQILQHMKEYLVDSSIELPTLLRAAVHSATVAPQTAVSQIKKTAEAMTRNFIAGESIAEAITIFSRFDGRREATFDIVGETTISDEGAQKYADSYLEGLSMLERKYGTHALDKFGMPKINMSVKLSAVDAHFDPGDVKGTSQRVRNQLRPTFCKAKEIGAFINVDMEHYYYRDLINKICYDFLEEDEFKHYPYFGRVVQAYLTDSADDLQATLAFAHKKNRLITIRLVKGAYWDHEIMLAQQNGWKVPVFTDKNHTDANYERLASIILQEDFVRGAFGTHNARSIATVLALAEHYQLTSGVYEFQKLFGNCEELGYALEKQGELVRDYIPSGVMLVAMGYFVRRLLENSSNQAFVRGLRKDANIDELLRNPMEQYQRGKQQSKALIKQVIKKDKWKLPAWLSWLSPLQYLRLRRSAGSNKSGDKRRTAALYSRDRDSLGFTNHPAANFSDELERNAMEASLQSLQARSGAIEYNIKIGESCIDTAHYLASRNPSTVEVLGKIAVAGEEHIKKALTHAAAAKDEWTKITAHERVAYLLKVADVMVKKEYDLAALVCLEAAKNRAEARAEIAEAIDFSRYYAKRMLQLDGERITQKVLGEQNLIRYIPYGVASIIAPWNFPIAILNGMVAAAVVTGNTVVMKPSPETPLCAAELMQIYEKAGLPPNVLQLVVCEDKDAALLVESLLVDIIAFTGSERIGKKIYQDAAVVAPGQQHFKKVVLETGGKNAIIIDSSADVEAAVAGCVTSAFGYAGQKCSAGSRFIVVEDVYDMFTAKVVAATKSLRIGDAADVTTDVTALINQKAFEKVVTCIARAEAEGGRVLLRGQQEKVAGYYVHPTLVEIEVTNLLAREEVFGPVAAIIRANNFDHAIEVANATRFALTAGLYSRTPSHIQKAGYLLHAGNIYINRPITGAIIQRQPFGGFKLSGTGTKAGGEDYLLNFMHQVVVTTNLARSGYVPGISNYFDKLS